MNKRPISITILAWIFIVVGGLGLIMGLIPLVQALFAGRIYEMSRHELILEIGIASVLRLLAVIAGMFILDGLNWARWLAIAWMGIHIVLSIGHSLFELLFHCALFVVIAYFLFRPGASTYFRSSRV